MQIIYQNGSWWVRSMIVKVLLWQFLRRKFLRMQKGLRLLAKQVYKVRNSQFVIVIGL